MPHEWNNIYVVTEEELVPDWYNSSNTLYSTIRRYKDKSYGIQRVQLGGNGRQMLIAFDSLPRHIQEGIGDPRKCDHPLEEFYKADGGAVEFFTTFQFADRTYLDIEYQEKYITNASVLQALFALKKVRETDRSNMKLSTVGVMATIHADAMSFNKTLKVKHGVEHTLPNNDRRFKDAFKAFEKEGYRSLVSKKHKNQNTRKVDDGTLKLLNNMFATDRTKPTPTEIHRRYDSFLAGYVEVVNNETGELYNPKEFKKLSERTVVHYMAQWNNKIGTHAKRSGNRQQLMQKFKPFHSLEKPKFAGSIISVDDRQPPFEDLSGNRPWFYNAIDLGSEAFTCWVYGKSKEGLILDFYRQLVRNYAMWGFNLPAELEAEMSLNSSFKDTFLREGAMFQYVRIEANNARGKRIEAYYRQLRYNIEKEREGWLARPFAKSESNQALSETKPARQPFNTIIEGCLKDIEKWNNMPHSVNKDMSRWEVFCEMQNPNLKPTNYKAILPYLGHKETVGCNTGQLRFRGSLFLLGNQGKVALGDKLISFMKQVEGRDVDLYWLDDNDGGVLKALVFIGGQYICEAVEKPRYQKARIEQTDQDLANREIISSYVSTIEAYGRRQKAAIEAVTIINNTPAQKKTFIMPGIKQHKPFEERIAEQVEMPEEETVEIPAQLPSMFDTW